MRDPDALFKTLLIRCHVDEGQLEMNRAVKEIQKAAPFLKDGLLILLLSQLIVDVLVLNGFCVVAVGYAADAVRKHPLKRDRLLRGARNTVILPCLADDFLHLLLLTLCEVYRQPYALLRFLFSEQASQPFPDAVEQFLPPPLLPMPAVPESGNSYRSGTAGSSGE